MKKYQIFKPLLDRIYKFIHIYVCAGSLKKCSMCPQVRGSRSTFEFPSRVNLSGPSLYCT